MKQRDLNATLGILGIFSLGIFLDWFPKTVLNIPMPDNMVGRMAVSAIWQTVATIVIPCVWAITRLGKSLPDMGLTTRNLGRTMLLGCGLYSLALAAFIHCSNDPLIAGHAVGKVDLWSAVGLASSMSLIAAGTDIATRGFILLLLAKHTHVGFAILIQNLTWFLGHIAEINIMTGCMGITMAVGLTLTLGLLGDMIALKTRNVVGLAFAHILLNVLLTIYIRQL